MSCMQVPLDRLVLTLADDGLPFGVSPLRNLGADSVGMWDALPSKQVPLDDEARELGFFGQSLSAAPRSHCGYLESS